MPQGTLDMVILQVVAAGPIHGYALSHRIRLISRDLLQIQQGSLYPALHRLEHRGFLAADWKASETGRDCEPALCHDVFQNDDSVSSIFKTLTRSCTSRIAPTLLASR